jgi:thiol-disulfide isomerase/thioredoxin
LYHELEPYFQSDKRILYTKKNTQPHHDRVILRDRVFDFGGLYLASASALSNPFAPMMACDTTHDDTMVGEDAMMQDDAATQDDTMMQADTMAKPGAYEVYSADKLAKANDGKVVLFFRASWCPTCKAADADIRAHLGAIPGNVTILDVDYDTHADLKKKYGVTYQHTFVQVDAQGNALKKWSGSPTLAAIVGQTI